MQETRQSPVLASLKITGLLLLACYVCRFWPMLIFVIIYGIASIVYALVKDRKQKKAPPVTTLPEPIPAATEQDVLTLAYSLICQRVTAIVTADYPSVRWIWESPNARQLIQEGRDVFILLNRAGGYGRAQVIIQNLQVTGVRYGAVPAPAPAENTPPVEPENQADSDYSLLAFQWVDAHSPELTARYDKARQNGLTYLLVPENELPIAQSWQNICTELARAGFRAGVLAEGIKITGVDENERCSE